MRSAQIDPGRLAAIYREGLLQDTLPFWIKHSVDRQYGGFLFALDRDAKGLPCTEYWHDMKFWWPHNEAIIATLLAYQMTGAEKYRQWHQQVHDWAYSHFPDPEYGEWYGYLHRDGTVSTRIKGNNWKGPFHLPRMQWYCWKLSEEMASKPPPPCAS
jgi:N-acylglucosamine 2-epimerase